MRAVIGFRLRHSTETALLSYTNRIFSNMDRIHLFLLCLLDLSKYFGAIPHSLLLVKHQGPYSCLFAYARILRTQKPCVRKNGILTSGLRTYDHFQICVRKNSLSCVRKQIVGILVCLAYAKSTTAML